MIPTYRYSQSSPMPIDLNNEDQTHLQLFSPNQQAASSSSSSLSSPIFYNPDQVQAGFNYFWEPKPLQSDEDQAEKIVPSRGSYDQTTEEDKNNLKLSTVWKKEEKDEEYEDEAENGSSVKWMSNSKMRIMQISDQTTPDVSEDTMHKFEDQKKSIPPFGAENNRNNSFTVRVCSDCHTTKTPLWRSGPRGPKSLCNACGIRQRKVRRAMAAAAAASASGATPAAEANPLKAKKFHNKEKKKKKKSRTRCSTQLKKKQKHGSKPTSRGRKKLGFEDFRIRLSKNLAIQQLVFPQDEKEAAILLMALSYGLVHG